MFRLLIHGCTYALAYFLAVFDSVPTQTLSLFFALWFMYTIFVRIVFQSELNHRRIAFFVKGGLSLFIILLAIVVCPTLVCVVGVLFFSVAYSRDVSTWVFNHTRRFNYIQRLLLSVFTAAVILVICLKPIILW